MKKFGFILLFFCSALLVSSQTWKELQESAETECNNGNYAKATELMGKAMKLAEKDKKVTAEDMLILNSDNASLLIFNDKVDEGIKLFNTIQKDIETSPVKPETEINLRITYGNMLGYLGLNKDALPQLKRAYDLSLTTPYDKEEIANLINSLAVTTSQNFKFTAAEELYNEGIAYCKKENLTKLTVYASLYTNLAILYNDMFYQTRALEAYEKAGEIYKTNKDSLSIEYYDFLLSSGTLFTNVSQYEKALYSLFKAKNLCQNIFGTNSSDYATVLNNIGYTYSKMNKITETEQYYIQAIQIKKNLANGRLDKYLSGVNNLLVFYNTVGRTEDAKEQVAELEKGLMNPKLEDTMSRATFAFNLAKHYKDIRNFNKAEKYFLDALLYYQTIYGSNNEFCSQIYIDLGQIKIDTEKYDEGTTYLLKATETYTNSTNQTPEGIITGLCNLSMILKTLNQYKEAEVYIDQAIEVAKEKKITNKDLLESLYITKALSSADLNKINESMEYMNKYLELKYEQIDLNFGYMTEQEKMFFLDNFELNVKNFYTVVLDFMGKKPELIQVLLNFRLKTKGLLLNNITKIKRKISEMNDPELNSKFELLKTDRENISKLMSLNTDEYPTALNEVDALKKEADLLEKEISLKVSSLTYNQAVDWKNIQKQLKPNEAAIEILQTNLLYKDNGKGTNYTYMIIKSTGDPISVRIDRFITWEEEVVTAYRNSINNKKDDPDLYNRLWKHVDEKLVGITSIYVSPDGIYNQINLNTIVNSDSKKYLIEEKNIHTVTTLQDLIDINQNPLKQPGNALLVGNPSFDYDLSKLPQNKQDFGSAIAMRGAGGFVLSELPGTKTEVETIKLILEKNTVKTTLYTEENANEATVKKIKSPDVLHFATHGFFLEDYTEETLADLTPTEQTFYKNPMMRSGLFFTGANKTYSINTASANNLKEFEDGMLTAYEAMNLNLDKTELVVLSACQTGLGKVKNGEGVFGLQRAFKLAGAKSIIMSLWPVSDEATTELMVNFYNVWAKTGNIFKSFKEAQLELKKKYPEPYYWGAFVLNGR